jgi:hypothetical protein
MPHDFDGSSSWVSLNAIEPEAFFTKGNGFSFGCSKLKEPSAASQELDRALLDKVSINHKGPDFTIDIKETPSHFAFSSDVQASSKTCQFAPKGWRFDGGYKVIGVWGDGHGGSSVPDDFKGFAAIDGGSGFEWGNEGWHSIEVVQVSTLLRTCFSCVDSSRDAGGGFSRLECSGGHWVRA